MSAASIGAVLPGILSSAQPAHFKIPHRNSFLVDSDRANVGRRFGDGSINQSLDVIEAIVKTAKAWARHFKPTKKAANANAPALTPEEEAEAAKPRLTLNMIETLEQILRSHMDFKSGACEATYENIMASSGFARATVFRHLKGLRELGWFDWVRRTTKANGRYEQTANAYFFEISRLPLEAQIHLRQLLKEKGIVLAEHADRRGSGKVPNRIERIAERLAKGFAVAADFARNLTRRKALMVEADFVRGEMEWFGDVPTHQWAALRHPGDFAAQEAYRARLHLPSFGPSESHLNHSSPSYRT